MALTVDQIAAIAAAAIEAAGLTPNKQSFWIIPLLTILTQLLKPDWRFSTLPQLQCHLKKDHFGNKKSQKLLDLLDDMNK
eukprot:8268062-Ditylum_brightwellii.AAC.1